MSAMRISTFARDNNVKSKSVIEILRLVAPDVNAKSASSRVEITPDNQHFWATVALRATFLDLRSV